jgi:threonine aldolase
MDTIDLRSDTVTHPTPAMREAMFNAKVGDDVYDEDPTIHEIQDYAADLLGKEAALYLPTATMSNIAAALTHCARGDELIVSRKAHMFLYEQGGGAPRRRGYVSARPSIRRSMRLTKSTMRCGATIALRTALICLENTAHGAGTAVSVEYTDKVGEIARGMPEGAHRRARLFNAAAALKVHPRELVRAADWSNCA